MRTLLTALRVAHDAIAPPSCAACHAPAAGLCAACLAQLGGPLVVRQSSAVAIRALGGHDGVLREAVHALKYRNQRAVASVLGKLLAQRLAALGEAGFEIILPVPLHPRRERERGFNQSQRIAESVAAALQVPVIGEALIRVRPTRSQSTLDASARLANVAGAFAPGPRALLVRDRHVLLVDDVVTTGATVRACADALRECRPARISVAALAIRA